MSVVPVGRKDQARPGRAELLCELINLGPAVSLIDLIDQSHTTPVATELHPDMAYGDWWDWWDSMLIE